MDKFFTLIALFSLPITIVICWTWLQGRKLNASAQREGFAGARAQLAADMREIRARVETLETIATLGDSAPLRRRVEVASRDEGRWHGRGEAELGRAATVAG